MTCFFPLHRDSGLVFSALLNSDRQKPPRALLCVTLWLSVVWCKVSEMVQLTEHQHIAPHAHLLVFQVLNLSSVVTISLPVAEDLEPWHANGVNHWTAIGKELHVSHLKHSISYQHSHDFYLTAHRDAQENLKKEIPAAYSHSQQSLWAHQRCTCQTAWYQFPLSGESSGGSVAQIRAEGRGWWGRPWYTQRWALPGLDCKRHSEQIVTFCVCVWIINRFSRTIVNVCTGVLVKLTWKAPSSPLHGFSSSLPAHLLGNAAGLPPSAGSCCNPC